MLKEKKILCSVARFFWQIGVLKLFSFFRVQDKAKKNVCNQKLKKTTTIKKVVLNIFDFLLHLFDRTGARCDFDLFIDGNSDYYFIFLLLASFLGDKALRLNK